MAIPSLCGVKYVKQFPWPWTTQIAGDLYLTFFLPRGDGSSKTPRLVALAELETPKSA